jgi:outer membrane protein OmpA-like peptidoglycan-associated protein
MKLIKNMLFVAVLCFFSIQMSAQTVAKKESISGGILGAANSSLFTLKKNVVNNQYNLGLGYAAGLWLNIPINKKWSFEPQFQYHVLKYTPKFSTSGQLSGTIQYQSVPLLMKYKLNNDVTILAGPQVDFANKLTNNDAASNYFKGQYESITTTVTGGLEFFSGKKLQIYARYMHGLSDMKSITNPNVGVQYFNRGVQAGLKLNLFGSKLTKKSEPIKPVAAPVAAVDTDKDGINDDQDKCPTIAGLAKYNGCPVPDTDKDGINDEQDKCPTVAGIAKYSGCPIPDTDNDGINDEQDKCPTVAGSVNFAGCPVPDTDNDGVNDEQDKCPTVPGIAANAGCPDIAPELTRVAKIFYFYTGTTKLANAASAKSKIVPVINLMKQYPTLKLEVEGYTDNTGSDEINNALSLKRAEAALQYLVKKGLSADRLSAKGFGSANPVADNKTEKGKALNRRVELVPKF